jgi:cation diffusion facilitator family transporter
VWGSARFAGYVSVHKLIEGGHTTHLSLGVVAAAVGIVGNQLVARDKQRVGKHIQSVTLLADAQHSWLDALASLGALLGLVGVAAGLRWADAVAGLIVTAFIIHVGWAVSTDLGAHLMDSVDPDVLTRAEAAALTVPEVEHIHARARWIGRSLVVDVDGFISPTVTVEVAEVIGRRVQNAIVAAVPETTAVLWSPHSVPTA